MRKSQLLAAANDARDARAPIQLGVAAVLSTPRRPAWSSWAEQCLCMLRAGVHWAQPVSCCRAAARTHARSVLRQKKWLLNICYAVAQCRIHPNITTPVHPFHVRTLKLLKTTLLIYIFFVTVFLCILLHAFWLSFAFKSYILHMYNVYVPT